MFDGIREDYGAFYRCTLQNEEHMSIGCLLPIIKLLLEKMQQFSEDAAIIHCKPLVLATISGLFERFKEQFNDIHLQLAALSDPSFKTVWVGERNEVDKSHLVNVLKSAVRRTKEKDKSFTTSLPTSVE